MHKRTIPVVLAMGALLFTGCYPDGPDYLSDYDIVYTNYSPSFSFGSVTTYSLPDKVPIITGNLAEGEDPEYVDTQYSSVILQEIRDNMNALGWQEIDGPNETTVADVHLLASTITSEVVSYTYYGGYWGWYYPSYPDYGWYYPGYYPTYTSYTSGSLLLQMAVPADVSPTNNVPVIWLGIVNGVLEGSNADLLDRIRTSIDQAFKQSAYLKK
jgi:hypothetical protein